MNIVPNVKKYIQLEYSDGKHCVRPRNRCGIDGYDDLLLPGHRWFAQLQVFASGEHFVGTSPAKKVIPRTKFQFRRLVYKGNVKAGYILRYLHRDLHSKCSGFPGL